MVIVFDIGNVLLRWDPHLLYRNYFNGDDVAIDLFLHEIDFNGWNVENDRGRPFELGTAELVARFPHYRELIEAYSARYIETLGGAIEPVVAILNRLKAAEYPLYVLSNYPAEKFNPLRPLYPFFELFDDLIISGEVGHVKPERGIYEILLSRVSRPAQECVFIDDQERNLLPAREMGMITIHYRFPEQLEEKLSRLGIKF